METHSCPTRPDTTKWEELELCIFFFKENSIFFYNAIFYFVRPVVTPVDFNVSDIKHFYTTETSLA